jgi:hypothetical protein
MPERAGLLLSLGIAISRLLRIYLLASPQVADENLPV